MNIVFLVSFTLAIVKNFFFDLLALIPIVGILIGTIPGAIISMVLMVLLFKKGRVSAKAVRAGLLTLGNFPIISLLPIDTLVVAHAYYLHQREQKERREEEKKQEKKLIRRQTRAIQARA